MELHDVASQLDEFEKRSMVVENWFSVLGQRFVNVHLKADSRLSQTIDVTADKQFLPMLLDQGAEKLQERLALLDAVKPHRDAPMVMDDIQPYVSMIDGSVIESRSKHRSHLKAHNCIEVGNETKELYKHNKPLESPPGLKEVLIREVNKKWKR